MISRRAFDALVYQADEASEEVRIAFPLELFDRNMTDGRMMMVSFLTLTIGNNQGMGDIEYAKMYDFYMPRAAISLFDGPAKGIRDLWRILGRLGRERWLYCRHDHQAEAGPSAQALCGGRLPVLVGRGLHQE